MRKQKANNVNKTGGKDEPNSVLCEIRNITKQNNDRKDT